MDQFSHEIRYIGRPHTFSEDFLSHLVAQQSHREESTSKDYREEVEIAQSVVLAPGETRFGLFAVQMNSICTKKFRVLRKLLPRKEYSNAKSRIGSRHHRKKSRNLLMEL